MATHSSVLAWRIPGTGEPSELPSMGSHRVRHDWSDLAAAAAAGMCLGGLFSVLPWSPILPIPDNMCPQMCPTFACCVPCHSQPPAFSWSALSSSYAHSLWTHRFCDSSFSHSSRDADAAHFFQGPDPLWPHPHLLILAFKFADQISDDAKRYVCAHMMPVSI